MIARSIGFRRNKEQQKFILKIHITIGKLVWEISQRETLRNNRHLHAQRWKPALLNSVTTGKAIREILGFLIAFGKFKDVKEWERHRKMNKRFITNKEKNKIIVLLKECTKREGSISCVHCEYISRFEDFCVIFNKCWLLPFWSMWGRFQGQITHGRKYVKIKRKTIG